MKEVAVLKYNAGNVRSVMFALARLGIRGVPTEDPEELRRASHVIFPGVGEASSAMAHLNSRGLDQLVCNLKQPVLAICLGLQLFCRHSEEGDANGLKLFDADVIRFSATLKVPHIGWNQLHDVRGRLFDGVASGSYVYFVHSFYAGVSSTTTARCDYGVQFSAAMERDNFYAVQFHPEKSGAIGERILRNFLGIEAG